MSDSSQNDDLLVAVMNKIAAILTGGDTAAGPSPNSYIAWCRPGIPFQPADLQFAAKGLRGDDGPNAAADTANLIRTAAEFARVANAVPTTNHIVDKTTYEQNGTMVWDIYDGILKGSKVPHQGLTDEEQANITKYRGLLVQTTQNLLGKTITTDSDALAAYKQKEALYNTAELAYNNKRLAALNRDTPLAVQDFALNGDLYKAQMNAALNDWVASGYKYDIEQLYAYIAQTTQRDMLLLKVELQNNFYPSKLSDPQSGEFYPTSFYPSDFVNNDNGWTSFTFTSANKDTYAKDTTSSTSASAGGWAGLFSFGGGGGKTAGESLTKMDAADFAMKFSLTQVTLARPWMAPEFITSSAWKWGDGRASKISDGGNPATGSMPAYPTTAVFVKDLKITSSSMKSLADELNKQKSANVSVGWGPFSVSVIHTDSSKEVTSHYDDATNTLTVAGMQLIAFKCFPMPLSPNPDPTVTAWT